MPKIFGLTPVNIQSSLSLNSGRGEMRISAVADTTQGDVADIPESGTPCYFDLGAFRFGGLLQQYGKRTDVGGVEIFSFTCVDPSDVLEAASIVTDGYSGGAVVTNIINVFGWWENLLGFGGSGSNSAGMEWAKIKTGISTLVNSAPGAVGAFGGPISYRGVYYGIDLSELPYPPVGYRIASNGRNLKELIIEVCQDCAVDFFCELVGTTIKIRVINRTNQPPEGGLAYWLSTVAFSDTVVDSSIGIESRNETMSMLMTGGYKSTVFVTQTIASYWGDDVSGNPIIGVLGAPHANFPLERCEYFTIPCLEIADLLGAATYSTNTIEMRAVLAGPGAWREYVEQYKPAVHDLMGDIFKVGGGAAKIKIDLIDDDVANIQKVVNENIQMQSHVMYLHLRKYADEFYGRKFMASIPEVQVKYSEDSVGPEFSYNTADSGYLPGGAADIGLGILDEGKFQDQDGRVLPFVVIPNANSVDAADLDPSSTAIVGGVIYDTASVSRRIYNVGGTPGAVVTMNGAIFERALADGGLAAGQLGGFDPQLKKNGAFGNLPIYIHPAAQFPTYIGVPLLSNVETYGPWTANAGTGKAEFIQDESLVPWEYGGEIPMNLAGIARVASKISGQVTGESGEITLAGIPLLSLGEAAIAGGAVAQSINIDYGVGGFKTKYSFSTFTPKYQGAFHRQATDNVRRATKTAHDARRKAIKGIARGILAKEAAGKAKRARAWRVHLPKHLKKESPHEAFIGKAVLDGSDVRVGVSTGTQEELLVLSSPSSDADYSETSLMSLTGILRPYRISGPEPTGSNDLLSPYQIISPTGLGAGNTNAITSSSLMPYSSGHDIEGLAWGATYSGYNARERTPNPVGIRPISLKGPLVIQGFGQGIEGKSYPTGAGGSGYLTNYLRRSDKWKTGPVDHLWDNARAVWTSHDIYRGTPSSNIAVSGTGTLNIGGNASWTIPIYNAGSASGLSGVSYPAYYVVNENRFIIQPTPTGSATGCCDDSHKLINGCVIKTSGYVTDIRLTWGRPDGSTYCEVMPPCSGSGCSVVYYCVGGAVVEQAAGSTAPSGYTSGPTASASALTCGYWCCTVDDTLLYVNTANGETSPGGCTGTYPTLASGLSAGCVSGSGEYLCAYTSSSPSQRTCTPDGVLSEAIEIFGRYPSQEDCEAGCEEPEEPVGGTAFCCSRALTYLLYASISGGNGSMTLTWDGSNYWQGSKSLGCGETLHLRFSTSCSLEYSCDGAAWIPTVSIFPTPDCGPPFVSDVFGGVNFNLGGTAGCNTPACGNLDITVSE